MQFSRGALGRSSDWDLHRFSREDSVGCRRHWQKKKCNFPKEDKIGLQELLVKMAQSWETFWART